MRSAAIGMNGGKLNPRMFHPNSGAGLTADLDDLGDDLFGRPLDRLV